MTNEEKKEVFARMVCHFLAEGLRTRKLSLQRAAEIAEKVDIHINLLDSEEDFLALIKELAKDFDELIILEHKIARRHAGSQLQQWQQIVRDFAVSQMSANPQLASAILNDACAAHADLHGLQEKYPEFKQYCKIHDRK